MLTTHPYHTPSCPEAKGSIGPVLASFAMIAGVVGPLNIIPQILKIFQTKSVANVSLLAFLIVISVQVVWLVYAIKLKLRPLLISSVIVILLSAIIVLQFFLYGSLI